MNKIYKPVFFLLITYEECDSSIVSIKHGFYIENLINMYSFEGHIFSSKTYIPFPYFLGPGEHADRLSV